MGCVTMKNIIKKLTVLILVICSVFMVACSGCNNNNSGNPGGSNFKGDVDKYDYTYPTIIVGMTEINLSVGQTFKINYALKNIKENITFSSKNQAIATVSSDGLVTAKDVGETIIALFAGGTIKNVVVNVSAFPTYNVVCDDGTELSLCVDEEFEITPVLLRGVEEIESQFIFESLDETVVSVSEQGVITPLQTGIGYIKASTVKDGKTFSIVIKILAHELCYIDIPDVIEAGYLEPVTLNYCVKQYGTDSVINGAEITIKENEFITVQNNVITPVDIGKLPVRVDYYGVEKLIYLDVKYLPKGDEFNFFTHDYTIRQSSAYAKNKYNDGSNKATLSIVNTVGNEQGRFLKIDVKNGAGNGMGYMNLYLQCVQSKAHLQSLLNSGYTTIKFEFFIDAQVESENSKPQNTFIFRWIDGELTGNINYGKECVYNKEDSFGKWVSVNLPLASYINHYDVLNGVDSSNAGYSGFLETSFEKNKLDASGNIVYKDDGNTPQKLTENNPYVIYVKPIKITK